MYTVIGYNHENVESVRKMFSDEEHAMRVAESAIDVYSHLLSRIAILSPDGETRCEYEY
jgi:hypothetical protein